MILLKLMYVFLMAGMVVTHPTEKKVVESEKSTKQEKIVEFGVDGKKNEKVLQSSETIHYPAMSPIFFGYHPIPYIAHYMPHYYPHSHTHGGAGGQQNGLTSSYGGGYGNFGSSYGGSGNLGSSYGGSGFGYGGHTHGHSGGGGYGGASQGYGGHGYGHGHEHGSWFQ